MTPTVSVIIPAHNAGLLLERVLKALESSTHPAHEIIVADDGSTDDTPRLAAACGARVMHTASRSGPARARHPAARPATGDILFFLDADVCAYPDTIERVAQAFIDPALDALIGSYDDNPSVPDFLSQYKNLMHCFVHQTGCSEASTFWSGCGAIRRDLFLAYSGFDESYQRPAIEDIELGYRLLGGDRRLLLDPDLQVKHLKRWSFWGLLKTDILDRGIPWTELILRDQRMPNDLNLQLSQRVSVALVYLMLGMAAVCAIHWRGYFLTPLFAFLFFLLGRYWVDGARTRTGAAPMMMMAGAAALVLLAWRHHMLGLIPLVLLSFLGLLVRHRYVWQGQKIWTRISLALYIALALGTIAIYLPNHPLILALAVTLLLVLILNNQFYIFLAAKRGRWFALAAVPFHLLYHFYNGLSFAIGVCRWAWRTFLSREDPVLTASGNDPG